MTILTERPTLYVIARRNDALEVHGESLRIRNTKDRDICKKIPALEIRDIVVCGDIEMKSKVFSLAEKYKFPIHFLSMGGKFKASTVFDFSKNVFLRYRQFQLLENTEQRLTIAKIFVEAKINNQNTFLQKIRAKGRIAIKVGEVLDLNSLRGKEGAAAQKYFSLWKTDSVIKNKDLRFLGRGKRPATDRLNALLSFCFSLLHSEVHTQLLIGGLDPCLGILHDQSFGHPALASDFVEIYRGLVEYFVVRSVNRREFDREEDFEELTGGEFRLSRKGFQKFFLKWSDFLRTQKFQGDRNLTRLIERDVRKFIHFLMGDASDFIPYHWQK